MVKIKKQISGLYLSSVLGNLSLTGAWVAILAARGFSLPQIGFAETVFHITSLLFELPSGVLADVFGRKNMLIISSIMRMISNVIMIFSGSFASICLSMVFCAMSFNFVSGSGDALAYDSMKEAGAADQFERYESSLLTIYRLCGGASTLCAGFALSIGYKLAYGMDLVFLSLQILVLCSLYEAGDRGLGISPGQSLLRKTADGFADVVRQSARFMTHSPRAFRLMLCNSLVGAIDILLLFFLQAKLPERGIPGWALGIALLFMEMGGIVGAKLMPKCKGLRYRTVFLLTFALVLMGVLAEHSRFYPIMIVGGFLSAIGDDALQVRTIAVLQDMFPSEQRATLTSLESFIFSVIMIVLSPLAGIVFSYW